MASVTGGQHPVHDPYDPMKSGFPQEPPTEAAMRSVKEVANRRPFPIYAGVLLGVGLGGFFDGIVLHQLLQWHHMVSGWYPINSIANLKLNTLWDGIFHAGTYVVVVFGLFGLWRSAHRYHPIWSTTCLAGSMLIGWGAFNLIEGVIDHQILGVHQVNELVPTDERFIWNMVFLAWGASMIALGIITIASCRKG
jgi:uncharacterized membrane protein